MMWGVTGLGFNLGRCNTGPAIVALAGCDATSATGIGSWWCKGY